MSTSSSISLSPSVGSGGTGLLGQVATGTVTLWEDAEQTGLTIAGIGLSPFEFVVSASGAGLHGMLGAADDIDLVPAVTGAGLHGGLGSGEAFLELAALGGGQTSTDIRMRVRADGDGLQGAIAAGQASLRLAVEGEGSGTGEHGAGRASLALAASGAGALGSIGTGSVGLILDAQASAMRGSIGSGEAAFGLSVSGGGWVDGIGTGAATLTITMRTGATGYGAQGWDELRNVGTGEALVMNASTRALSGYAAFPMNSVAVFNGKVLGAHAGGIAVLEGDDDDGTPIDGYIENGDMALDDAGQCRVSRIHVEYRSAGPLEVSLRPDGTDEAFIYRMEETRTAGVYRNRVKVGRGFRASRAAVRISNVDGADFTLRSIEVDVESIARKVS